MHDIPSEHPHCRAGDIAEGQVVVGGERAMAAGVPAGSSGAGVEALAGFVAREGAAAEAPGSAHGVLGGRVGPQPTYSEKPASRQVSPAALATIS